MLRRLIVPLMILALVGAACSSTTVISEGMLTEPTKDADGPLPSSAPVEAADPAQDEDPDANVRGDRDLGDQDLDAGTETPDTDEANARSDTDPSEPDDETDFDFGLGGDDQLAGLVEDCEDGSDMACDILYSTSPVDSLEEEIALSCGGRVDVFTTFCSPGIEGDGINFWFDEASPGLPTAVASCEDGDMTACDFLYFRSPIGSEYEDIGNTCGGRIAVALPDCRTAFG